MNVVLTLLSSKHPDPDKDPDTDTVFAGDGIWEEDTTGYRY